MQDLTPLFRWTPLFRCDPIVSLTPLFRSISRHLMLPETGRAKIKARVFELLRFMPEQYHKTVSISMRRTASAKPLPVGKETAGRYRKAANDAGYTNGKVPNGKMEYTGKVPESISFSR